VTLETRAGEDFETRGGTCLHTGKGGKGLKGRILFGWRKDRCLLSQNTRRAWKEGTRCSEKEEATPRERGERKDIAGAVVKKGGGGFLARAGNTIGGTCIGKKKQYCRVEKTCR